MSEEEKYLNSVKNSFYFDGNTYLTINKNSKKFNLKKITFMAWIKPEKQGDIRILDCSTAGADKIGYGFDLHGDKLRFLGSGDTCKLNCQQSNSTIKLNEWNHVAITLGTKEMKWYINGKLDKTVDLAGGSLSNPENKINIGKPGN
jgi:hypothetical protein